MVKKEDCEKSIHLSIRDIANQLNVSPATIRNWEKYGLFTAKRNENGYRYFDLADIAMLKRIRKYMIDDHGRTRAQRKLKSLQDEDLEPNLQEAMRSAVPTPAPLTYSGKRWRDVREGKSHTLEDVSSATGISVSYLSKIENGLASPSYEILLKLAQFYGESLIHFMESESSEYSLTRRGSEPVMEMGYGDLETRQLSSLRNRNMYPVLYNLEPGANSGPSHAHNGEEFIYILAGKLTIYLNDSDVYILNKGDALSFKATTRHRYLNATQKITSVLWVHSA